MLFNKMTTTLAALVISSGVATAENWDMATPYPEANFHTQNIQQFADDVAAATNGKITITVHAANSLIAHPEIKNSVRAGTIPLGEFLLGRLSNEDPIFALDLLPFVVSDYDDARAMWAASRPKIEEHLARQRLRVLFSVPWPTNGLYTDKELSSATDLNGVRMRTYNTTTDRFAELVGAVPTQIEVSDTAQAFSTGRVEAMITAAATGVAISAWDFVDRYYDVNSFLGKNIVVVNEPLFAALPEATQKAVLEAAAAAETRGWKMSMENDAEMAGVLASNGMTVEKPSDQLRTDLQAVGALMLDEWLVQTGDAGAEIMQVLGHRASCNDGCADRAAARVVTGER